MSLSQEFTFSPSAANTLKGRSEEGEKGVDPSRAEAIRREYQLKKWSRAKKESLIKARLNDLKNLSKSHD